MSKFVVSSRGTTMMRVFVSTVVSILGASSWASAAEPVDATPNPAAGWEMPPPISVKTTTGKKIEAPACCGFDKLCCARQAEIDRGIRPPARQTFAVPFSKVPEATMKEASAGGPPIEGIKDVRVVDGAGTPFPWQSGPKLWEIRIIPEARVGFIRFGKSFSSGHYGDPKYRSLGYGITVPISDTTDNGRSLVKGPLEYWLYNRGEGDAIVLDYVKGKLDGSPKVIAERWAHVSAVNGAEGIVHVYRMMYEGNPYVFFLLPEVVVGFDSKDAKTFGGTGNDRFASDFPYTEYRFPLGPGRSNMANCFVREYEVKRWFERPKDAAKLPEDMPIIVAMSQTSVENEPQIRIMFL